jgi:hypothetical protein
VELFSVGLGNAGRGMTWRESWFRYCKETLRARTLQEIISKELREAQLNKLEAESAVDYAKSVVTYNEQRIARLQKRLIEHTIGGESV